jgi:hypothetical protein
MARPRRAQPLVLPGLEAAAARPLVPVSPAALALSSRKSKRHAPAPRPWECVVLGADTARRSGWCVMAAGRYCDSGEVDTLEHDRLLAIVARAQQTATANALPLVLVLEKPWGGNPVIVAALGQARERWLVAWRASKEAAARVQYVQPVTWRSAVIGAHTRGMERAEIRALEQQVARALVPGIRGEDEAPAVLIARWASHAPAIGERIGVRATRKSVAAWTAPR